MRRAIIHLTVISTLLITSVLVSKFTIAETQIKSEVSLMDAYQGPTVTISGEITFPAFEQSYQIKIIVETLPTESQEVNVIAIADLAQPGKYSIKVPRDQGEVLLKVRVLGSAEEGPAKYRPIGEFTKPNKSLSVGRSDIKEINFLIKEVQAEE
jgi:hypothetical protein